MSLKLQKNLTHFRNVRNELERFFIRKKALLTFILLLSVSIYGYEIFNFSVTGDEERELVSALIHFDSIEVGIEEGRFGYSFLKKVLFSNSVFTPVYATLLATLFLTISAFLWCFLFDKLLNIFAEKKLNIAYIIFCGMFLSVPYATTGIMCYSTINTEVMFGVLLIPIILLCIQYYMENASTSWIFLSVFFTVFALSIYQSLLNDIVLGSCIVCFLWQIQTQNRKFLILIKRIFIYVFNLFCAFIIYYLISANLLGDNDRMTDFFVWGTIPASQILQSFWSDLMEVISWNNPIGRYLCIILVLYFMCLLYSFIHFSLSRLFELLLGFLMIICAVITDLSLGTFMHPGAHTSFLLLFGFLCFYIIYTVSLLKNKLRMGYYIIIVLLSFIVLRHIEIDNKLYYGGNLCAQLDMQMGYQIGQDIIRTVGNLNTELPVVIWGSYQHSSPSIIRNGMVGRSIFARKNYYKIYYLNLLGFPIKAADDTLVEKSGYLISDMPCWPQNGSILITEDMVIVKISENN